ncbi:hypothetical protein FNF29_01059 [Cafeteria roenbergensis]|nr:hypothetical protein FNF29_01059 [Cafeteria roenbergensis]|eukprot:KAA0156266.1 hypothetical protein FNF29_01059 [Cafeteria roenbergensis]
MAVPPSAEHRRALRLDPRKGQLNAPRGVAVDAARGLAVVANTGRNCLTLFSLRTGEFIRDIGRHGAGQHDFNYPSGVAFMPQTGWIVVADMMNNRVVLLTVDGDFIGQFGSSGVGLGNMQHPADVAVAESYIVVSEWSGQRLQLFTLMGAAVRIIEVPGEKECYGVCFDAQRRRILAVDRTIVGWSEYSLSGEVLRRVCANSADCPLRRPCGVGVNSLGQILLSDAERNSIHKFRQDGSWAGLLIQGHTSEFESDTAAQGGPVVMRTPPVIDGLDVKMSEPMDSHAARAKELEVFPEERFLRVGRIFAFPCLFDVTESNVFVSCILSSSIEWVVDTDVSYSRRRELIKAFAWLHSRLRPQLPHQPPPT